MIGICPNCRARYSYNSYDKDYIHSCKSSSDKIQYDDILVVGNYVNEETGSVVIKGNVNLQGLENKSQGTDVGIEGKRTHDLTSDGNIKSLYRQRKHEEFIEL